ncbi:MAG: hypothetical protein FJ272_07720 [Planctomycetes bacterium]|nr:hypothetical protein [Planctomycetota bacterium]
MNATLGFVAFGLLVGVVGCASLARDAGKAVEPDMAFGVGIQGGADAEKCAQEACLAAQRALGKTPPKAVFLCDNFEGGREAVLRGAAKVFPSQITHGVVTYAQFTQDGAPADKSVAALALGGDDLHVTVECVPQVRDKEEEAGKALGEKFQPPPPGVTGGKLLILVGDCHVPKNQKLVAGVQSVLGKDVPIVGAAAKTTPDVCVYYQGKVVPQGALALLLTGNFRVGLAAASAGWNTGSPDDICRTAKEGLEAALKSLGTKPALVLAFDCGGRLGLISKGGPSYAGGELAQIKPLIGAAPLLALYGSGEIGHTQPDKPAEGVGFHIAYVLLSPRR